METALRARQASGAEAASFSVTAHRSADTISRMTAKPAGFPLTLGRDSSSVTEGPEETSVEQQNAVTLHRRASPIRRWTAKPEGFEFPLGGEKPADAKAQPPSSHRPLQKGTRATREA